jgi:hypothetical protein
MHAGRRGGLPFPSLVETTQYIPVGDLWPVALETKSFCGSRSSHFRAIEKCETEISEGTFSPFSKQKPNALMDHPAPGKGSLAFQGAGSSIRASGTLAAIALKMEKMASSSPDQRIKELATQAAK